MAHLALAQWLAHVHKSKTVQDHRNDVKSVIQWIFPLNPCVEVHILRPNTHAILQIFYTDVCKLTKHKQNTA